MNVFKAYINTCSLIYFSIPESFFPSRLASETLFFREGVLRHDLSEHWKEHEIDDKGCCALLKTSDAVFPPVLQITTSNAIDEVRPFNGSALSESDKSS